MRRRWLSFGLAFALAVGTALWIGWTRFDKLEPQPRQTLTPGEPVELRGLRFSLESFGVVEVPESAAATETPDGTVWVQLTLRQEMLSAAVEEHENEWYCSIELVTDEGMWETDTYMLSLLELHTGCTSPFDEPAYEAGDVVETHGLWLVPEDALVNPRVLIQFTPPPAAIEVRPEG
ncbi:MAG TPA: hypothetical protein GX743_09560 [Actinomycetales bacterium]|nr:hypothetical protein [Actinomycetales bacterium]